MKLGISLDAPNREPSFVASPASAAPASPSSESIADNPGTGNAAIDRCLDAYAVAYRKSRASGQSNSDAKSSGKAAYLRAMPPLAGPQNVSDFIACVMRAVIEDFLYHFEINKYLYAAQVANCVKNPATLPAPKRPRGRPSTAKTAYPETSQADNSSANTSSQS